MVSCVNMGGLGNCLFIWAAVFAYARKHNMQYCIPTVINNPHYEGQKVFYSPYLNYCDIGTELPVYKEPSFFYTEIPYMENIRIEGYFQSWRYGLEYRKDILEAFNIPYEFKENVCSIHTRRGDYLKLQNFHPVVTSQYLSSAILEIFIRTKCTEFIMFGDDSEWNKSFANDFKLWDNEQKEVQISFTFSEGKTELEDLSLMSSCAHNICANSAFSWWGAWLNPNPDKVIIMPKKWFGGAMPHNTTDLYIPGSIIL